MHFIDYRTLKDFYTVKETAYLFNYPESYIEYEAGERGIRCTRNAEGEFGFYREDFRKLHYGLYQEYMEEKIFQEREHRKMLEYELRKQQSLIIPNENFCDVDCI